MPDKELVGPVVTILGVLREELEGGDITLASDRVSTNTFGCDRERCPWREKAEIVNEIEIRVIGTGLRRARLELLARFEFNGCDVNDARITLGSSSFVGFLSGAEFRVTARAGVSQIRGPSGCTVCCPQSSCVNFDIQIISDAALTFGTGTLPLSIRICGDGSVTRVV